ncbi:MAG: nitroreductase family protein [Faecousia sp.]
MNEMVEKMLTRHAIRRFQDRQVPEELLEQILQAGLYAPSAGNNQYSRIVVCQDAQINEKLGRINRYMQFKGKDPKTVAHSISAEQPSIQDDFSIMSGYYHAPTVLTIFTKNHKYAYEDAAMIGENILLAAHFLDLGACYVGRTEEVFATEYGMLLRKEWGIPEDMVAVCNVLLGYRDGPVPHEKPRKEGRIVRV